MKAPTNCAEAPSQSVSRRFVAALAAGTIAISINVVALSGADLIHVATAHGGILKLLCHLTGMPVPHSDAFNIAFHVTVGLVMAIVYGVLLSPLWRGPAWILGLIYAAVVWIANAFLVLPLINQGIAGSASLSLVGVVWFAIAHTVFFLALSFIYEWLAHPVRSKMLPTLRDNELSDCHRRQV